MINSARWCFEDCSSCYVLSGVTCSCTSYHRAGHSANCELCIVNSVVVASTCVFVVVHCASVFQCFSDISEQCFVLTVLSVLLVVYCACVFSDPLCTVH